MSEIPHRWGRRLFAWLVLPEGSTRSLAVIRIGIVALIWCKWASEMALPEAHGVEAVLVSLLFFAATALMFVGLWTRVSAALTALVMVWIFYYRGIFQGDEFWFSHHTTLLTFSAVLIALTPCGRSLSIDRFIALRKASRRGTNEAPAEHGELWGLRLIQIQVFCVYFWSFIDKLNPGFLSGERLQSIFIEHFIGSFDPTPPGFETVCWLLAWVTIVLEITLAVGLFAPRFLRVVIPLGIILHGAFYVVLSISVFSLNMLLLYLAFVPVAWFHRGVDEMFGWGETGELSPSGERV